MTQNTRITQDRTCQGYRSVFRQFCEVTGATKPDHVNDERLLRFMEWCKERGDKPHTINQKLAYLSAYANDRAKRYGDPCKFPTVRSAPLPQIVPKALTLDEMQRLFESAALHPGRVGDIDAGLWWNTLCLWFWNTGERTEASLTGVHLENLTGDTIILPAEFRKGRRKVATYVLPEGLGDALRSLNQERYPSVFHWEFQMATFYVHWQMIIERAGIPYIPRKTGPQIIRRSFASHLEANGLSATEALMHTSRAITKGSYLDPRIAKPIDYANKLPKVG